MRHPFCKTFSFRRLPHGTTSPTAPLQLRLFFTRLSVSQFSCRSVFDTTFRRPPFFVFLFCVERFLIFFLFQNVLCSAWCLVSRYCPTRSFIFLLEPTRYRVVSYKAQSDNLSVYPAFGSQNSRSPKSGFLLSRPSLHTSAVNTDPMEIDVPMFPSAVLLPVLSDFVDSFTLTSPVPSQSVTCLTDCAADMECAALLKGVDELEALRVT